MRHPAGVVESAPAPAADTPFVVPAAVMEVPEYPQATSVAASAEGPVLPEAAVGTLAAEAVDLGQPIGGSASGRL